MALPAGIFIPANYNVCDFVEAKAHFATDIKIWIVKIRAFNFPFEASVLNPLERMTQTRFDWSNQFFA